VSTDSYPYYDEEPSQWFVSTDELVSQEPEDPCDGCHETPAVCLDCLWLGDCSKEDMEECGTMSKNVYELKIEIAQLASQLMAIENKAHGLVDEAERMDDGEFGHEAISKARWEVNHLRDVRVALLKLTM